MTIPFGIDVLLADAALQAKLRGRRIALLAHPASMTAQGQHSLDALAPLALHAVKSEQMRRGRCAALELVQVHHLQAVACAGVVRLALGSAHGGTQSQAANAAKTINCNPYAIFHASKIQIKNEEVK